MLTLGALKVIASAAAGFSLAGIAAAPALASSPDKSWLGVRKILILTQVTPAQSAVDALSPDALCRKVQAIASAGAPASVECSRLGDPALQAGNTAVLSVQAAISDDVPGQRLLLLTIKRDAEAGLEPAPIYFGSIPRAIVLSGGADQSETIDRAIRESLRQILPWFNQSNDQLQLNRRG